MPVLLLCPALETAGVIAQVVRRTKFILIKLDSSPMGRTHYQIHGIQVIAPPFCKNGMRGDHNLRPFVL